jgi:hypothetical protein
MSHTTQAGAVIPHKNGILHFRRVATVNLCKEKEHVTSDESQLLTPQLVF